MSMPARIIAASMTLAGLLKGLADAPEMCVSGIASDTRLIGEGFLFLACGGISSHGLDYAQDAIDAGAIAVAYDTDTATSIPAVNVPLIPVAGLRGHLGDIANRFYDHPSESVRVVGITGTNGKTTVAWLLAQCLQRLDRPSGYAGTLGFGMEEIEGAVGMTTPDVLEMHRRIAVLRDAGAQFAAVEVSSHALAQRRIEGIKIDTAMFTNLSRDHLDYHGDMRAYGEAKASLFLEAEPRRSIVNVDTDFGTELAGRSGPEAILVSSEFDRAANGRPHVFLRSAAARPGGSDIVIQSSWGNGSAWLPLVGDFNIANALLVAAYLLSEGVSLDDVLAALGQATAPPGRMQRVAAESGPAVYVDYAHTPHALEVALRCITCTLRWPALVCVSAVAANATRASGR